MSPKVERRFASWEEYSQEFAANLKNFGLFIPGPSQARVREKLDVEIWLPGSSLPVPARAEVVAAFPAGVALSIENGPEILKQLEGKEKTLKSGTQPVAPSPAPQAGQAEPEVSVDKVPEETGGAPEVEPEPERPLTEEEKQEEAAVDSGESAEEIEKRVLISGADYSNLFLNVRRLGRMEKIKLAKRGNRRYLSILIQEGDRQLLRFVLQNPHLSSVEVLQILKNPQLTTENISELARNPAFAQNEEVRYQIVIHPKTPLPTALSLLISLNQRQLSVIAKSKNMRHQLKSSALKLLIKRQSDGF